MGRREVLLHRFHRNPFTSSEFAFIDLFAAGRNVDPAASEILFRRDPVVKESIFAFFKKRDSDFRSMTDCDNRLMRFLRETTRYIEVFDTRPSSFVRGDELLPPGDNLASSIPSK